MGPTLAPEFAPTTTQTPAAVPLRIGGTELPGWAAPVTPAGRRARRDAAVGLVRAAARGARAARAGGRHGERVGRRRGSVALEFAASPGEAPIAETPGGPTSGVAPRDLRALAPEGTTLVRVRATSAARATPTTRGPRRPSGARPTSRSPSACPRVPRTVPFDDVVPPGSTALVDWPVAFAFPCLRPARRSPGGRRASRPGA